MKIIDRYVAKNFLIGYVIAFCVLMGLRTIIDLFVNLDEFTEQSNMGTWFVIKNIFTYYGINSALYFRDFAGMITVVAAVFSLGKMIRANELVAIMSSGVSLKRVIAPIIVLSLLLTGLLIVDQELIIPPLSDKLRDQDEITGEQFYGIEFISDNNGSLICSLMFDESTATLINPTIITRQPVPDAGIYSTTGRIDAEKAVYNYQTQKWDLVNATFTEKGTEGKSYLVTEYASDLTPRDIPLRQDAAHKTLLSSRQLSALAAQKTKVKDQAQLYSQKYFRITDPIINFITLMVALPILVCRDPKTMKSAIMISFAATSACFITSFACKMLAAEVVFNQIRPLLWAWLPVFIFFPIAFLELDSMKT